MKMVTSQTNIPRARSWRRRLMRIFVVYLVIPYVAIVLLLAVFQRSLIYGPIHDATLSKSLPACGGARVQPIHFAAGDRLNLHGWHIAPANDPEQPREWPGGRPVFLFFCGNGGHRGWRAEEFRIFAELGAETICFDYRGYGENEGTPSEEAIAADVQAIWNHITGELGVDPGRVIIFGESLGGGVATRLASELSASGTPPAGLVLRSTFTSLTDAAAWHFRWVPVRWLLLDRYPSIERIAQVTCPILILHGRRDTIVPFAQGEQLFTAAPERSSRGIAKRFFALESADHNDVLLMEAGAFREELESFLGRINPH